MERDKVFQEIAENCNAIVRVGESQYRVVCGYILINGVRASDPSHIHFLDTFVSIDNVYVSYVDINTLYVGKEMEWDDNGPIGRCGE